MAIVKFGGEFRRKAQTEEVIIEAPDLRTLLELLTKSYGPGFLDGVVKDDHLTHNAVILVDQVNIRLFTGLDTPLDQYSEVILLPFVFGG